MKMREISRGEDKELHVNNESYMSSADFDTVTTIAAERNDISVFMSSTPTGKRSKFYEACTNKAMGYSEHYHPSTHNPNWGVDMETEFRAQLSDQGFVHEILAEFGTEEVGVFNKDKLDLAIQQDCYTYSPLNYYQQDRVSRENLQVENIICEKGGRFKFNPYRTMGIDWDKHKFYYNQVS